LCGLTGFKPTATRVSLEGVLPLSKSLDSVGPLGRSVNCCRVIEAVLSGRRYDPSQSIDLRGLRIAVPTTRVFDDIEPHVAQTFDIAISTIADAGAQITQIAVPEFDETGQTAQVATFPAAEGFAWHRELLARAKDRYDPRIAERLERGRKIGAADYIWLLQQRERLIAAMQARAARFDVLMMPTVPITAPLIVDLERDSELYHRLNLLVLRNPTLINFLNGCALSLPCHREGDAPVGLMLARFDGADSSVLGIGQAIETALAVVRQRGN
jgi:aspartyl-tRNA(Asn)/glutamyl-tRNA(Gln) amidotransferase subunit A